MNILALPLSADGEKSGLARALIGDAAAPPILTAH
jgi:hypothetical protein